MIEQPPEYQRPRWLRDLIRFLHLKPQFVLSGNVRDYQVAEAAPGQLAPRPLIEVVAAELFADGYVAVVKSSVINCFQAVPRQGQDVCAASTILRNF